MKLLTEENVARVEPSRLYTSSEVAVFLGLHVGHTQREIIEKRIRSTIPGIRRVPKDVPHVTGAELVRAMRLRMLRAQKVASQFRGVRAVPKSNNAKLGFCATTTVARQSCPSSCLFQGDGGCYAEHDNNRRYWDELTLTSQEMSPLDLAHREAEMIDGLPADRDLRLHIAGDSTTSEGTQLLAVAAGRYIARGRVYLRDLRLKGGLASRKNSGRGPSRAPIVWAYTHAWREVERADWGPISILASCETVADIALAHHRGYAAALVVSHFADRKTYQIEGAKVVPCPAQTSRRTCTTCRLCFDDDRLRQGGLAIGFAAHGLGTQRAKAGLEKRLALPVVENPKSGIAKISGAA